MVDSFHVRVIAELLAQVDSLTSAMSEEESVFWTKVRLSSDCWIWSGSVLKKTGYGQVTINKKRYLAHRKAYELHYGELPKDLMVLHRCDNRLCVNPNHLRLGTHQDNMDDMVLKGRSRNQWTNGKEKEKA